VRDLPRVVLGAHRQAVRPGLAREDESRARADPLLLGDRRLEVLLIRHRIRDRVELLVDRDDQPIVDRSYSIPKCSLTIRVIMPNHLCDEPFIWAVIHLTPIHQIRNPRGPYTKSTGNLSSCQTRLNQPHYIPVLPILLLQIRLPPPPLSISRGAQR
jgi:hypothetical protein